MGCWGVDESSRWVWQQWHRWGASSQRNLKLRQFLLQLVGRHFQKFPPGAGRQGEAEMFVRGPATAAARAKAVAVPVQAFQAQQTGRQVAVAGLLHPHDAVDPLHQTARPPATTQHATDGRHYSAESRVLVITHRRDEPPNAGHSRLRILAHPPRPTAFSGPNVPVPSKVTFSRQFVRHGNCSQLLGWASDFAISQIRMLRTRAIMGLYGVFQPLPVLNLSAARLPST